MLTPSSLSPETGTNLEAKRRISLLLNGPMWQELITIQSKERAIAGQRNFSRCD